MELMSYLGRIRSYYTYAGALVINTEGIVYVEGSWTNLSRMIPVDSVVIGLHHGTGNPELAV